MGMSIVEGRFHPPTSVREFAGLLPVAFAQQDLEFARRTFKASSSTSCRAASMSPRSTYS